RPYRVPVVLEKQITSSLSLKHIRWVIVNFNDHWNFNFCDLLPYVMIPHYVF
ncbi:hypothetical protein BgiBS90_000129, partial [Biomphalaria glabrata]